MGGFGRSHEKLNFLWALRKVTREQNPNLTVAVPLFSLIKNNCALNLKEHLLCCGEAQESNLSVYSLDVLSLCTSWSARLCKLLIRLILVL